MGITIKLFDEELVVDKIARHDLDGVLHELGLVLNKRCGGEGACGGCKVVLEEGAFTIAGKSVCAMPSHPRHAQACRTRVVSEHAVVRVPSRSLIEVGGAIEDSFQLPAEVVIAPPVRTVRLTVPPASLSDCRSDQERIVDEICRLTGFDRIIVPLRATQRLCSLLASGVQRLSVTLSALDDSWKLIVVEDSSRLQGSYGMAIDIGTTTVVGLLVDLETGAIVQNASRYNGQVEMADDVAARISAANSVKSLERLQRLVVLDTLNPIIDSVCHAQGIDSEAINYFTIAGNTVMAHLMLGLDVANIGRLPFNPRVRYPELVTAGQLRMHGNPEAHVEVIPAVSGYIGGDITADICVAGLDSHPDGTLLVDIGTNAEVVLKDGLELICCATPAGPAFEGGGLLHGCRAAQGAITHVTIGADLAFALESVGTGQLKGVCGSAIIDFIAEAYRRGLINRAGRFDIALLKACGRYAQCDIGGRPVHACVLAHRSTNQAGEPILVTESDIAQVLQAKAAIFSGIRTLLEQQGRSVESVPRILLAGGFARHINLENAMCIGMLPQLPSQCFLIMGNGALAGAYLAMVDRSRAKAMRDIHLRPRIVELNLVKSFESNFIGKR